MQPGPPVHESSVQVRIATANDAAAMAELIGHLGYPAEARDLPDRLARMRSRGDAEAFVAISGDDVVGVATVHTRVVLHAALPVVQLTALVTSPSMRNRGVGRALVDVVQSWALERGAEKLVVTTALHRVEAPRFYERLGFEQTGRRFVKRLRGS
jgi:GNAT superfamily N-acetyltransferase